MLSTKLKNKNDEIYHTGITGAGLAGTGRQAGQQAGGQKPLTPQRPLLQHCRRRNERSPGDAPAPFQKACWSSGEHTKLSTWKDGFDSRTGFKKDGASSHSRVV
jgi:hypothetical protein